MMSFFANLFGYILKFLYDLVNNYGIAIILFSVLVKILMLPLTIKQQKSLKKNAKMQEEMKQLQFKYKNDPEQLNQEIFAMYKREGTSPFSGCLTSIVQLILLFSVFLLVRSPLTYMVKMDTDVINKIGNIVVSQDSSKSNAYKEISIIQYVKNMQKVENADPVKEQTNKEEEKEAEKENKKEEQKEDEKKEEQEETLDIEKYKDDINLNMDLFGIDLSQVPTQNLTDWKTLIIPVLYVITSFISIKLTTAATAKKKEETNLITDGTEEANKEDMDPMKDMNKSMSWLMPVMSISIAIIAPLGLALYWLMNNILMIVEKLVLDKFLNKKEEEAEEDA